MYDYCYVTARDVTVQVKVPHISLCNGHSQNNIKCSAIVGVFVIESHVVQVCVMALDSDLFLTTLLQRYKLDPWFKFGDFASTTQPADTDVQQVRYHVLLYYLAHYMYICNLHGRFNHTC